MSDLSEYYIEEKPIKFTDCRKDKKETKPKSEWRCPKCKSPPNLKIFPLDGGSVICSKPKCPIHFHWCSFVKKEVEGPPLHKNHSSHKKLKIEKEVDTETKKEKE